MPRGNGAYSLNFVAAAAHIQVLSREGLGAEIIFQPNEVRIPQAPAGSILTRAGCPFKSFTFVFGWGRAGRAAPFSYLDELVLSEMG